MHTTKDFQLLLDDRETLKLSLRRSTPPSGQSRRARILLARRERSSTDTARLFHLSRATVHSWHRRYRAEGVAGLVDQRWSH